MTWKESDLKFLRKNYLTKGAKYVAESLNRPIDGVKKKAQRLGIVNHIVKEWSEAEILFLKENYKIKGCKFVCETLNRNRGSVSKKAKEFSLKVESKNLIDKEKLTEAIKNSYCYSDIFNNLNKKMTGSSLKTIKKLISEYGIDINHFDQYKKNKENCKNGLSFKYPISHWLVFGSNIGSHHLKLKLYKEGLKKRECELCGQGEEWKGKKMSLILDHINGIHNDNRLENLRIVCPNCNATLETHGGKNIGKIKTNGLI